MSSEALLPDPHSDDFLNWTVRARTLAGTTGAPTLACLAGLKQIATAPGEFRLGFAARPGQQRVGLVELAMLVDLALGGALRQTVGRTRPLPTLSLTLELTSPFDLERSAASVVVGETAHTDPGTGTAAGNLIEGQRTFGHCAATFAVPSRGEQNPLPWDEQRDNPTVVAPLSPRPADATDQLLARSLRAAEAAGQSWGDHLLSQATSSTVDGLFHPSTVLTNRVGAVQGGVLFALAARYGAPQNDETCRLASATMRFLSGTDANTPIIVQSSVEHVTRRTLFSHVRLLQGEDQVRASAGLVYRR